MKKKSAMLLIAAICISVGLCGCSIWSDKRSAEQELENDDADELSDEKKEAQETNSGQKKDNSSKNEEKDQSLDLLNLMIAQGGKQDWREDVLFLDTSWEYFKLGDEDAKKYPKLQEAFMDSSREEEELAREFLDDFKDAYLEEMGYEDSYFSGYTQERKSYVQRADNHIVSIRVDGYSYTGGAHPMYGTGGRNIDSVTGEELELDDILTDTLNITELIADKLQDKYADDFFDSPLEMLREYDMDDYQWTMDYQGITIYFSPYELASYAAGLLEVDIWFDENPELFKKQYLETPKLGYGMEVSSMMTLDLDPSDGKKDTLQVTEMLQSEWGEKYMCISLNGQQYSDENDYGYQFESYLVHLEDMDGGKDYLYVNGFSENDYAILYVYDLNQGAPILTDTMYGTSFMSKWYDEGEYGTVYKSVPVDPSLITLETKVEILGTMTGSQTYTVDPSSGKLKMTEQWYDVSDQERFCTSCIDLEVFMLADQSLETIPAGSKCLILRTDDETYAELRLEDGSEFRIEIDNTDWPANIGGVPVDECFDGIIYAG